MVILIKWMRFRLSPIRWWSWKFRSHSVRGLKKMLVVQKLMGGPWLIYLITTSNLNEVNLNVLCIMDQLIHRSPWRRLQIWSRFLIVGYILGSVSQTIRNFHQQKPYTQSKPCMNILYPTFIYVDCLVNVKQSKRSNREWCNRMRNIQHVSVVEGIKWSRR